MLSLSGVLIAGSAAALVNTQVLNHNGNYGAAANVHIAGTTSPGVTSPSAALPLATTPPENAVLPPDPAIAPATLPHASTQAVYQVGDAGMVTLDTANNALTVVLAAPNSNWTLREATSEDSTNIEVKFESPTERVEFHATLLFGVVGTSIETKSLVPAGGGAGNAPATTASSGTVENQHRDDHSDDHVDGHGDGHGDDHENDHEDD